MQMISSAAGTRLAKAKASLDAIDTSRPAIHLSEKETQEIVETSWEWAQAAAAVADELIEQGFHEMEGA